MLGGGLDEDFFSATAVAGQIIGAGGGVDDFGYGAAFGAK